MTKRLLTPSKITAWLDCDHFLTLQGQVDTGAIPRPGMPFGSFAQLLADKGIAHETACLEAYRAEGRTIFEVPPRQPGEMFDAWAARVDGAFGGGHDVIYQMPLAHDGIRGIADFLVRSGDGSSGVYEPVDAKLARAAAKPGHVLQLCFYAEAIEALTGATPPNVHLWLGSGEVETIRLEEVRPYWNRIRLQLAAMLDAEHDADTVPEPCVHCAFCEFAGHCEAHWRSQDSLIYVADIRRQDREALMGAGVATLARLADIELGTDGAVELRPERLARLVEQAKLQVKARSQPDDRPPHRIIEPSDDPRWGRGFSLMPQPDDGDVFLDFEGHPFWRADTGLFFLLGLILREADGVWTYHPWWAHDLDEEAVAASSLIDFLAERRRAYPGMHVYHYNHTERSSLQRLASDHGVGEVLLDEMVGTGLFVDLLDVARNALQVGVESYGLKHLERLTSYERSHEIDQGAGAVVEYEDYMVSGDAAPLKRIATYNEDDVRATRALRDLLVELRPEGADWRPAYLEPDEGAPELDAQVTALHAYGPGTVEHLLGDVLGYWRREWLAAVAPKLALCQADSAKLLDDPEVLTGLARIELVARTGKNGLSLIPAMRFALPQQAADAFTGAGDSVLFSTPPGPTGYASIGRLDLEAGELDLLWNDAAQASGAVPSVVVLNDWVSPRPKPESLSELASRVLDPSQGGPNLVSLALLGRDLPRFTPGGSPPDDRFGDDLDEMTAWVTQLDRSVVAIQGPPGTGKTFRGAHLVRSLLRSGRRVGITAMSHAAIDNLLKEIVKVLAEDDHDLLRAVRKGSKPSAGGLPGVRYVSDNRPCANDEFNLVAGTTWLLSNKVMRDAPVDVLIVDEAGQLALADALAASRSARSIVLLGDPLQLPQVSQAVHPGGGGASVLEHVMGEETTIPPSRGVFLPETRRMHPDVSAFISQQFYEGRLTSHPSCEQQQTELGTGLRWVRVDHTGRSTESPEEVEAVAREIRRLIGTPWTNQCGERSPITAGDIMVVAPYNDQVKLLRAYLDSDAATRGVHVGTVDKFQGQQAAVVFFTMTTSNAALMPRNASFLFSRNRLNVAISRARCLAYLVCTEELLNTRARTVEEMRLLAALCDFVERC